jgi:hypothetical protein
MTRRRAKSCIGSREPEHHLWLTPPLFDRRDGRRFTGNGAMDMW